MAPRRRLPAALSLAVLLSSACLAAASQNTGDTVVFWGRNRDEGTLREACDAGLYTTVVISFLSAFGQGRPYTLDISGHPVAGVGDDIKYCQSRGKLVLLAIGGQGGEYWLPSSRAAADLHDHLWNTYLRGDGNAGVSRPFGDAVVNGIDFFIDQGATEHYDELARLLDAHNKDYRATVGVMLTATARCGYPDQRLQAALATGLFHRVHVKQFGDGRCASTQSGVETFKKWAAAYRSRVLVGVVASPEADRQSYISPESLNNDVLPVINKLNNFGGVMVWNRYWDKKTNYTARLAAL
ncbi:xylanase inhibitor protein XIP-like [Oryza brachyantha]|uniref:xylanase inhibitor protein XIP-like n=1 Tax=Oryza brachyantha TaxID=4533 RepID=UPI001ADC36FF|nr:xylanase inhibitor protein XIP-like [Oryza brachyantha]